MKYDYIPIIERKPLKWPNNARVALILTINLEHWDMIKDTKEPYYAGGPPVLPDMLPGNVVDWPNYSWREYGQRVGVWRIFDVFDKLGAQASCTINAVTALERPQMVQYAVNKGWEIVAHNYEQGELLVNYMFDESKEKEVIKKTLDVYEKVVGKKAKGWLSSSLRGTLKTADIIAEEGLIFYCDLMNDDQPYLIETSTKPIVSTPYSNEINDFTHFHRRGFTTDEVLNLYKEQLDVLWEEGASTGKIMNVGLHPHVSGLPYRIRALKEFIEYAQSKPDVWITNREEIATWYLENHKSHI
ncbi:MAG: polysaccharide deacetylase [Rhodospirillaceae bacterium]|nr:polysaccharide deacetylase [Rhodospirillaceae bacterium]|tara:strand:+ start:4493 stop:5392 length:900 start_codon:yes stop_codon:yes gene_type:complete